MPLPKPLYTGNGIVTTVTFTVPGDPTPRDPTTVELSYKGGTNPPVTYLYGTDPEIVRSSQGVYTADLATDDGEGSWIVQWEGFGACAAVSVERFTVTRKPIA